MAEPRQLLALGMIPKLYMLGGGRLVPTPMLIDETRVSSTALIAGDRVPRSLPPPCTRGEFVPVSLPWPSPSHRVVLPVGEVLITLCTALSSGGGPPGRGPRPAPLPRAYARRERLVCA